MPQYNDYHVDPVLTNLSIAYSNSEYINSILFPRLTVKAKSGIYYKFDKSKLRPEDARRTGQERAARVDFGLTKASYGPLTERSLEEAIEWEIRDTYPSPMDAQTDATENVTERLEVSLENELAAMITDTGTVTQNTTLSGTSQWSDYVNSDPRNDVRAAKDVIQLAALKTPNTLVLGYEVYSALSLHPDLLGSLSNDTVKVLSPELLASILGVERIIIAKAVKNTAVEGQTDSLSYIWGKNAILMYINPRPAMKQITAGYTLTLENGRYVDAWTEEAIKNDFVRVNDYMEFKLMAVEAMYLIKNAVA